MRFSQVIFLYYCGAKGVIMCSLVAMDVSCGAVIFICEGYINTTICLIVGVKR